MQLAPKFSDAQLAQRERACQLLPPANAQEYSDVAFAIECHDRLFAQMTHDEVLKHTRVMIRLTAAAQRARSLSACEDATHEVEMMKRLEYARAISESQLFKAQQACQALAAAPKTPANATFSRCLKLARIDSVEVVQKLASESCQWTNSGMTKGDTARAKALLAKVWLQLDRLALHIGYCERAASRASRLDAA